MVTKKIGLLLGDETDWPEALALLLGRLDPHIRFCGETYRVELGPVRIRPFALGHPVPYHLLLDRLSYWHYHPREWLKKAALVNDAYQFNSPFTFQCFEKHAAYAAMHRLGLNIPETWLLPALDGAHTQKYRITAAKYHDSWDLAEIGRGVGYPLYMKPFDGAGGRAVQRCDDGGGLTRAHDESGQVLMLVQAEVGHDDGFLRSLGVGPQVLTAHYDPRQPMHAHYLSEEDGFGAQPRREAAQITKIINAFFCWDFNSCELVVKDSRLWPIDFANAYPDVSLISLHRFFPWVLQALLNWMLFCAVTGRPGRLMPDVAPYFRIADSDRGGAEKMAAYEELADAHFNTESFEDFRATHLSRLGECLRDLIQSPEFDKILVRQVQSTFPPPEHDSFIAHYRGLLAAWSESQEQCPEKKGGRCIH